jgi:NAD(P)-dependent dehydrogenase (short-subunit alcohol dehydrogenase family)
MSEQHKQRVWFITGASTGFGKELATQLLTANEKVVATARKPEQIASFASEHPETALVTRLDVTDQASVDAAVAAAIDRFGRVDVLVNNAGYGIAGGIEETTEAEFMPVFETNVFGLIRVTRALLPYFRKQRSGNILNLSSIAGINASAGWGYYNTSKFAVNGFSDALAQELAPLGVHVTVIEPGPFRTDFLGRSHVEAAERIPDYESTVGKTRQYTIDNVGKQAGDPVKAVKAMIAAVHAAEPPRHLVLGKMAFERAGQRAEQWKKDLEAWRDTSLGADFDQQPEGK